MSDVAERLDKVEKGLGAVDAKVDKLRILGEQTAADVKIVAEVLGQHGEQLERHGEQLKRHGEQLERHGEQLEKIVSALQPLADLHTFVRAVADVHERRITALEEGRKPGGPGSEVPAAG